MMYSQKHKKDVAVFKDVSILQKFYFLKIHYGIVHAIIFKNLLEKRIM